MTPHGRRESIGLPRIGSTKMSTLPTMPGAIQRMSEHCTDRVLKPMPPATA